MPSLDPRTGSPDPTLSEQEYSKRFLEQFQDQAFDPLRGELDRIADAAWDAYSHHRKSPRTRKAGPGFADPDYDLAVDWIAAYEAIREAEQCHQDRDGPLRILIICGAARSEHTCPGEMSKTYRLAQIAHEVFAVTPRVEVELLELSRLTSEYGRHIHPCKTCFSTAAPLCH